MKNKFIKSSAIIVLFIIVTGCVSCSSSDDNNSTNDNIDSDVAVIDVNASYFTTSDGSVTITTVPCTLSDGTTTDCYQIVTSSLPTDHTMGPWCPDNISDDASAGGIWLENGQVYDVDGAFIENMATFYNDANWMMYDSNGDIFVTDTEEDCINAANPNVGAEYENFV
jgi:exopolysaccharide biosynthesis protein